MTKKKKIIISAICVGIILIGLILGIVLANVKRYSMKYQKEFDFNNHTTMTKITWDAKYTSTGVTYNNGVRKFRTSDEKYGLFSLAENKMIVDVKYKAVDAIYSHTDTQKSYFKLTSFDSNRIDVVDEKGQDVGFLRYSEEGDNTYTNIKARDVNLTSNKDSVKTNINNNFVDEEIKVKDISVKTTYYEKDLYFYEVWNITSTDNIVYQNLYKITNEGHQLIQTINNEIGISLDNTNHKILFLTNGTPVFINSRTQTFNNSIISITPEIYDINFNPKGSSTVDQELIKYTTGAFRIGDSIIAQFVIPTTEEKYDYSETNTNGETYYYNVKTYKFSLKNGSFKQITFDYLINNYYDNFNLETALINASKIEDKSLNVAENILINERLQMKTLNYEFNTITKIKDDRYIASIDGTKNFNLIDKGYNLIAHLENCSSIFATNDAIIAKADGYYYICNVNGVIIKKYSYDDITDLKDDQYYLKRVTKTDSGKTTYEFYLEQLGLTQETPLYTYNETDKYIFKGNKYDSLQKYITNEYSFFMGINKVDETYTYSFYTIDGTHLNTITGVSNDAYTPVLVYSDDTRVVLYVSDQYFTLDR